jgi:hypothetical protein
MKRKEEREKEGRGSTLCGLLRSLPLVEAVAEVVEVADSLWLESSFFFSPAITMWNASGETSKFVKVLIIHMRLTQAR